LPSKEITDDLELLLRVVPPHIRDALHRQSDLKNLIEVVMDLGRPPEGRFPSRAIHLERIIDYPRRYRLCHSSRRLIHARQSGGIERTLHRISGIRIAVMSLWGLRAA
jgi:stage III sporulation protein SpoIIIAA